MSNFLKNLLSDESVHRIRDTDGTIYGIRVLGRGENMFFQKNNVGLICSIDILNCGIEKDSIDRWGDGNKISEAERDRILPKIVEMFEKFYCKGKRAEVK